MKIEIYMNDNDFEKLCTNAMRWAGLDWDMQLDRFEHATEKYDTLLRWDWKMAYWIDGSWVDVMFARAFLKAQGEDYEIVHDTATEPAEYVILTDFQTESLKTMGNEKETTT